MSLNVKVAIKSCHRYPDRRKAQFETWLPALDADWFWILGSPSPAEGGPVITDALAISGISDAFENIAPKVLYACKYALETSTDHLWVMDDDTYAVPERLATCEFEKTDYFGFIRTSGLDYNDGKPYAQGSCYCLSARSMEIIVANARGTMRDGVIDDGAVGQTLYGRVLFTHSDLFEPGPYPWNRRPLRSNAIASTHKCNTPEIMRRVHQDWKAI